MPLIVILAEVLAHLLADAFFGSGYSEQHRWIWAAGLLMAAAVCWLTGRALRRRQPPLEAEPQTGREPAAGTAAFARNAMREIEREAAFGVPRDSFFFVHVSTWGLLLTAAGLILLILDWI